MSAGLGRTLSNLANLPPLGQKAPKKPKGPRKPIPKQSRKRKAYMASAARVEGLEHMAMVAALPCLVCGAYGVEVHHETIPHDDMLVLPLCPRHHRREFGPGARHYSPKAFYAKHGTSRELLDRVNAMLRR